MIERRKGTYVSCSYTRESEDKLAWWCSWNMIPKPLEKHNYHSTILYSRKELSHLPNPEFLDKYMVRVKGFQLFPSDKGEEFRSLVLLLDASELEKYHQSLIDIGGTHDFDDYTPHISVTYYADKNMDLRDLILPIDFELEVYGVMIFPLNLNWNENE